MAINFAAASTAGLNNPGTEIITLVKDGSGNFINPPSYDKMRAYLQSGEVPVLFVTDAEGKTGDIYQFSGYSETENKIRFSNDTTTIAFSAGASAPAEAVSTQPDWNQNDSTAADYVKNRPFYSEVTETVLVEESTLSFTNPRPGIYYSAIQSTFNPVAGEKYNVSWDGTTYECVCITANGYPVIGNLSIIGAGADTGEPFVITPLAEAHSIEIYTLDTAASHILSVSSFVGEVVQIPDKYISNTFRDIVNAGDPLTWKDNEWNEYYALFLSGKLLRINTNFGTLKRGYVLSMFYGASSDISFIDYSGIIYSLEYNNAAGELYWRPFFDPTGGLYLRYLQAASDPTETTLEYAVLKTSGPVLTFRTQNANEELVERQVVLTGDKELILSSSTTNSTKKFKITVDDSGTISATEVT